jgi:hypothetical protein
MQEGTIHIEQDGRQEEGKKQTSLAMQEHQTLCTYRQRYHSLLTSSIAKALFFLSLGPYLYNTNGAGVRTTAIHPNSVMVQ